MDEPTWAEALSAWSSLGTAVLTLALVVLAAVAWKTAAGTLEESRKASVAAQKSALAAEVANDRLRLDSAERTRPYVYVEVLPSIAGTPTWDVRIRNTGQSAARAVRITPVTWPTRDDLVIDSLRELCETPLTLPPTCSIRAVWRIGPPREGETVEGPQEMGMDERVRVRIEYLGGEGEAAESFSEEFELLTRGTGLWPVPEDGPEPTGLKGDLRKFYLLGQALARRIGEISR